MDRYLTQETWGVDEAKYEYEHCALSHDLKQQKMKKVGLNAGSLRPLPTHTPLDKKKNKTERVMGEGRLKAFLNP